MRTGNLTIGIVLLAAAAARSAVAASVTEVAKLLPSDGATNDQAGESVSVDGDIAVVGASLDDDNGDASGSAYVFERNAGEAHNWGEVAKLLASDGAAVDVFGEPVSVDGDTVLIGAHADDDDGSRSGSAYVFDRDAGGPDAWGQVKKLTASDAAADDFFGISVSLSGDTAVVGARLDDDNGDTSGSAYVFCRDAGGADNWGEVAKLLPSDGAADDLFGHSASVSGDVAVIGAHADDDNGDASGSAYVFYRNAGGPDNWGQVVKLLPSDGAADDHFSTAVCVSGGVAVVGAEADDDNGDASGSAYIFERNAGGADNWGQVAKLLASDGAAGDIFGKCVSISGGAVAVGAYYDDDHGDRSGSAYVFHRDAGGVGNWGQIAKMTPADGAADDRFGDSISIDADTIVVGAYLDDEGSETSCGSAYVFVVWPPTAVDDFYSTYKDKAFTTGNVLVNDTDPDNDTLSVQSIDTSGTLGLVIDNGDGTFYYDPVGATVLQALAPGESADDTFTYTVRDEDGGPDTATVTITVAGMNEPSGGCASGAGLVFCVLIPYLALGRRKRAA